VPRCDGPGDAPRFRSRPGMRSTLVGGGLFFNRRPALGDPLPNRLFVSLPRLACWSLQRPAHLAQNPPHVPRMVMNAGHPLDDLCHAWQRPQVCAEPLRPSPLSKSPVHLAKLCRIQSRHPTGTTCSLQRGKATAPPLPIPSGDALSADRQRSRDPRQCAAALRFPNSRAACARRSFSPSKSRLCLIPAVPMQRFLA
jgi:hypothetical protein